MLYVCVGFSSHLRVILRRKHALTLQVHTAHILSAHASLDEKGKALQDVKEQKNRCVLSVKSEYKANTIFLSLTPD